MRRGQKPSLPNVDQIWNSSYRKRLDNIPQKQDVWCIQKENGKCTFVSFIPMLICSPRACAFFPLPRASCTCSVALILQLQFGALKEYVAVGQICLNYKRMSRSLHEVLISCAPKDSVFGSVPLQAFALIK